MKRSIFVFAILSMFYINYCAAQKVASPQMPHATPGKQLVNNKTQIDKSKTKNHWTPYKQQQHPKDSSATKN